jgi:hypothetical protein
MLYSTLCHNIDSHVLCPTFFYNGSQCKSNLLHILLLGFHKTNTNILRITYNISSDNIIMKPIIHILPNFASWNLELQPKMKL